ncbi:hypothetical protein TRAPUB_1283 [Trametes pubescens]|uniref:DUF659 domain-containing protein n=1 Tax=Trametes pubescens TaxID=154538 RepID=A0A1M2VJW2_TRAPU|nr:hypothetical protein TRAPUB_1283 [Trametes pubescens]
MTSNNNPPSISERLGELRYILENLPKSLPEPKVSDSRFQAFVGFVPDPDVVDLIGSEDGAVNHALEVAFGFGARSKGLLPIEERGPPICGLVDALELYQRVCAHPDSDALLDKWITDIREGAEHAYNSANEAFPPTRYVPSRDDTDTTLETTKAAQPRKGKGVERTNGSTSSEHTKKKRKASSPPRAESAEDKDQPIGVRRTDLVDIPWRSSQVVAAGRPPKEEIRLFAIKCKHKTSGKQYYRCLGKGCDWFRAGTPQRGRLLKHAVQCRGFTLEDRKKANNFAARGSLGAELGEFDEPTNGGERTDDGTASSVAGTSGIRAASPDDPSDTRKEPKLKDGGLNQRSLAEGRAELKKNVDLRILKLVCVRGLVPKVIDSQEWKNVLEAANPKYTPTSSSTFVDVLIPAEAAKVRVKQLTMLQKLWHLTLTYDGATTQKPQSVYTIHITTQDRRVFFIDGAELSKEAHTAEKVKDILLDVMESVGVERFSGVCSDSAGNTRKARQLLASEVPGLIDMPDCCHHLHNTAKDITKLSEFKGFISNLRKLVTYFRKSTKASADLTAAQVEEGLTRGLQSVGKTRFATVYWSAESLRGCLPVMRQLYSSGKLSISKKKAKFDTALLQENNMVSMKFEQELTRYTSILAPIARAIKSLEATDATAADVYLFWLGIASSLKALFARSEHETGIPRELAQKITGIINKRYKGIIDHAPDDIYFNTYFLHPKYVRSDVLARPTSMSNAIFVPPASRRKQSKSSNTNTPDDDSEMAPIPRAYTRVKMFLKTLIQGVIEANVHPLVAELGPAQLVEDLRNQLLAYALGEHPFDVPLPAEGGGRPVLQWWLDLEHHRHARVLAMLAIKLYSVAVNSMAEERTVSTFTWFNSRLRNNQQVQTLVDMIQVRQWYLYKDYPNKSPTTHPTVRWADLDKEIFACREQCDDTEDQEDDNYFQDWPSDVEARGEVDGGGGDQSGEMAIAADTFELDALANLSSSTLRTMLSDLAEEEEESDKDDMEVTASARASAAAARTREVNWDW